MTVVVGCKFATLSPPCVLTLSCLSLSTRPPAVHFAVRSTWLLASFTKLQNVRGYARRRRATSVGLEKQR